MLGMIDYSVQIDFKIPEILKEVVDKLEEADRNDDYSYDNYSNELSVDAKNLYADGKLTKKQWNTLERRYG